MHHMLFAAQPASGGSCCCHGKWGSSRGSSEIENYINNRPASVKRPSVCERHICFAHGFPHIPDPPRVRWEKDSIARPYLHRLAAFRCEEAVAGDEMAQLRLFYLAGPHARRAFPLTSLDLLVW